MNSLGLYMGPLAAFLVIYDVVLLLGFGQFCVRIDKTFDECLLLVVLRCVNKNM